MTTNQLRIPRPAPGPPLRVVASVSGVPLLLVSAAAAGLVAASHPEWYRSALALALGVNLVVLGMKWPRAAALATLLFLPFLALIRRLLIADAGFTSNDPLLLVAPVVALFLLYRIYIVDRRRSDDLLFKLVGGLLAFTILQVFNPFAEGGLVSAAIGLLFVGAPLLWFFAGRELGDRGTITTLMYGTIVVACLVAVYGLVQTQIGTIASWDKTWLDINGYTGLNIGALENGNKIRPFSTFSSNQEYATFLAIGTTLCVAFVLRLRVTAVLALPLLLPALFLAGGRGSLVMSVLAGVVLLALLTRSWLSGILVVLVGCAVIYAAAATFGPRIDRAAGLSGNAVVERNVTGILKPLDPANSTVIGHWGSIVNGFAEGVKSPAGHGAGASTLATNAKLDTENDLSNAFVNLGLLGGLLYATIIVLMFRVVFARYVRHRDALSFAVAGLLVVTSGQWLNGAEYAVTPLVWFLAGWATRPEPAETASEPAVEIARSAGAEAPRRSPPRFAGRAAPR
jgi:hypothetical protein